MQAPRQLRRRRGCSAGCLWRTPPRMHEEHCCQQPGIHAGGQAVGLYPRLPVDWSQSIASLGTATCATGGVGVLADPLRAWIPAKGNSWEMATIRQARPSARRTTSALVSVGLALSASDVGLRTHRSARSICAVERKAMSRRARAWCEPEPPCHRRRPVRALGTRR